MAPGISVALAVASVAAEVSVALQVALMSLVAAGATELLALQFNAPRFRLN